MTHNQRKRDAFPQPKPRPERRASPSARGYGGKRWARLRRQTYARDGGVCQACGELVRGVWHCDHIRPKDTGGADAMDNLQVLCIGCHNRKTAADKEGG